MLFRFCLYGFLKNQQYYDAFLILAFREKGLSFTWIGLLIGFREICINIMEIPTGAIADVFGRRRSMILSHISYCVSFVIFGLFQYTPMLFMAMLFFAIGEAFRTGTHKAIIFNWLEHEGRPEEKTLVYGITRSWSELGSALSVVIAAVVVFSMQKFNAIFFFCLVPYALNIVNFLTYPAYLDGVHHKEAGIRRVMTVLLSTLTDSFRSRDLRRLLVESMTFDGVYNVTKDYLQPLLKAAALSLPLFVTLAETRRVAVLVGAVYCGLYILTSLASRHSHSLATWAGTEDQAARRLWRMYLAAFVLLTAGVLVGFSAVAIVSFVALAILQNLWRPIQVSRFADQVDSSQMATVLSVESQSETLFSAIAAPLLGLAVDHMSEHFRFMPIALLGVFVCVLVIATERRK